MQTRTRTLVFESPDSVHGYDVVIVLSHPSEDYSTVYERPRSPKLVMVEWKRVVMDEVQI